MRSPSRAGSDGRDRSCFHDPFPCLPTACQDPVGCSRCERDCQDRAPAKVESQWQQEDRISARQELRSVGTARRSTTRKARYRPHRWSAQSQFASSTVAAICVPRTQVQPDAGALSHLFHGQQTGPKGDCLGHGNRTQRIQHRVHPREHSLHFSPPPTPLDKWRPSTQPIRIIATCRTQRVTHSARGPSPDGLSVQGQGATCSYPGAAWLNPLAGLLPTNPRALPAETPGGPGGPGAP